MSIPGSASPLLLTSAAGAAGYEIERSLRFNSADSAYLNRTPSSAGNRKTWTWSGWVKLAGGASTGYVFGNYADGSNYSGLNITAASTGYFRFYDFISGSANANITWSSQFRDFSAWYHLILVIDTTQSTSTDRIKFYVNSVLQPTLTASYPAQNADLRTNQAIQHNIGALQNTPGNLFDGYLADVHFIDGQALAATDFGEFDANNVWQPIAYSGSYGTNGFHLDFSDNSSVSALGTDSSGNGNDWTVNNIAVSAAIAFDQGGYSVSGSGYPDYKYITLSNNTGQHTFSHLANNSTSTWFFSDTSHSYQQTHSTQQDQGNTSGYRNNGGSYNNALSAWGTFATANSVTAGHPGASGGITGLTGLNTTNAVNYWTFVVDTTNNKVWIDPGTGSYVGGGNPSNTSSTPTLYLPSGVDIRFWSTPYTSTNSLQGGGPEGIDSLFDSPTNGTQTDTGAGGEVSGGYCVWNPLNNPNSSTFANGNLEVTTASTGYGSSYGTMAVSSGKWYWEVELTSIFTTGIIGIIEIGDSLTSWIGGTPNSYAYLHTGQKYNNGSGASYGATYTTNDIIGVALDMDAGTLVFYKNGSSQGTAYTGLSGTFMPGVSDGGSGSNVYVANFGQRPFASTSVPSGYKALCTANLPDPTIADGSTAMDVVTYSGDSVNGRTVGGLSFQPEFAWIKTRNNTGIHALFDVIRGTRMLTSSGTNKEDGLGGNTPVGGYVSSFTSDGFELTNGSTSDVYVNESGYTYVGCCWDGGSSTVSNTDGSITSSVRANASAGFSIVSYTGDLTSAGNSSIGHGLGIAPSLVISKSRSDASRWVVQHTSLGSNEYLELNTTAATANSSSVGAGTLPTPTSSVFYGSWLQGLNINGQDFIAYCWAPVEGYSAFGSYTGNGSSDGPFVYTGFRPRWILIKNYSPGGQNWILHDTTRNEYNVADLQLLPSAANAEYQFAGNAKDILSNGFKLRGTNGGTNASGELYIYAAFAETPQKFARAR